MKCIERNKRTIAYKLYIGNEDIRDDDGYLTGDKRVILSEKMYAKCVTDERSDFAYLEKFGVSPDYEMVLKFDKMDLPFDENTVFFIDDIESDVPDYEVKWIRPTLNVLGVMVQRINKKNEH